MQIAFFCIVGYYQLRQAVFAYGGVVNDIMRNPYINALINMAESQRKNFTAETDYVADEISFWVEWKERRWGPDIQLSVYSSTR